MQLAENLGIRYEMVPIDEIFGGFNHALAPVFAGSKPDITEENIQSRIRGALLMAFSNKFNALVLTTGNKSEMSTGYCTLYGDMVGALAVIGDVFKTRVYDLCRCVNRGKGSDPSGDPGEAAVGGTAAGAEGYGLAASLRSARPDSGSLRRTL